MRKFLSITITTLFVASSLALSTTPASAVERSACTSKNDTDCVYDAEHSPFRFGERSYKVSAQGEKTFISHKKAHRLIGLSDEVYNECDDPDYNGENGVCE